MTPKLEENQMSELKETNKMKVIALNEWTPKQFEPLKKLKKNPLNQMKSKARIEGDKENILWYQDKRRIRQTQDGQTQDGQTLDRQTMDRTNPGQDIPRIETNAGQGHFLIKRRITFALDIL